MKQLKTLFTVLLLAVLGLGNAWGAADYTLDATLDANKGKDNGYATAEDITVGDITWNVTGNSTMSPWRIGGKNLSGVDRAVYSKTAYASAVSKIDLTVGAASSVTVNSLKLVYSTNADFSSSTEISGTFAVNSTISFTPASGDFPANAFYKFVFNVTIGSSNKFIEFKKVEFYNATSGNPDPEVPTLSSIAVKTAPTKVAYTEGENFDPAGLVITKTMSNSTTEDVAYAGHESDFTFSPALTAALATTNTKVTITYGGKTADQAITVTAAPFTPTAGTYEIALNNALYGVTTGNNAAEQSVEVKGITIVSGCKSSASNKTYYDAAHIRYYTDSYLKLTAPAGFEITQVVFTAGGTWNAGPTVVNGTYDNSTKTWTGKAVQLDMDFAAQNRASKITVTYAEHVAASVATPELTVAAGTYEGAKNVKVSNYDAALSYYYTLDGNDPTAESAAYNHEAGIDVTASATLKVIAYDAESNASDVASAAYTIIPVYASIAELLAAGNPTTTGWTVKVTLTDVVITSFQSTKGVWVGDIELYGGVAYPSTWAEGGKLSGTLTCTWKLYGTTKELCPSDWTDLTYTAPTTPIVDPEYASLAALIEGEGMPLAGGKNVKVTFTDDVITGITTDRKGIFFMVGEQEVEVYCTTACPAEWTVNGQVAGELVEGSWKLYNGSVWEVVVADWTAFTYTPYVAHVTGVTFDNASVFVNKTLDLAELVEIAPADASNKNVSFEIVDGSEYITLEEGVVTGVAEGAAVVRVTTEDGSFTAEATITVEAVSVWATTYTSNVDLANATGTSISKDKVKVNGEETEYAAIKAGTSKTDGNIKVSLPLGTTKLHFHAVTWSGSAATATLSVKKDGDATELFGNVIRPNAGLSNNSPYTLVDDPVDDYYCIDFGSALTEAITLVFDASVNRFAIYGVNVEKEEVELQSIAISGTPTQLEYYVDQALAPAGLVVTGTYNLGAPQAITEGVEWTVTPAKLALGTTSVTVTAKVGEITSEPFVVNNIVVKELSSLGEAVVIVFPYDNKYYALKSNLSVAEVHLVSGKIVGIEETDRTAYTWYKNEAEGKATFKTIDGNYLAGSAKTNLGTQATEYKWDVVDGHYQVTISGTARSFIFNGSEVKNYAISNAATGSYSDYANVVEAVFVDGEYFERELNDKMGTHCYPFTIKAGEYTGAHFYVPTYREGDVKIFWDEVAVDEDIVAGNPYLVVPAEEGAKLEAVVNNVEGADAQTINGFVGSYEQVKLAANAGNYVVYNNQFRLAGANVAVGANRAYIVLADVEPNEVAPAPGRRRIVLNNASVENATALENITEEFGAEQVAKKVVINGTIYIVRGAEVYTVEGQLVK